MKRVRQCGDRLQAFLFAPDTSQWLALLRIGMSIVILAYTVTLARDWQELFGGRGAAFVGRRFSEALLAARTPFVPRLQWITALSGKFGIDEAATMSIVWAVLLVAGIALALGLASRAAAAIAWFLHLCTAQSAALVAYGADNFITIGLFYLMLSPLPDRFALHRRWRAGRAQDRHLLGFFRRLLQVHLCFVYAFSGLTKALGRGWWNGDNLWRALIRPPFNVLDPTVLVQWRNLFPFAGIAIVVLELGYAGFMWPRQTRPVWLIGVLCMHIAIGVTMGMYLFAFVMIVLNLAAFAPGVLWRDRA